MINRRLSHAMVGPRRRGGIYVLVLGAATLLSVMALTSLAVLRINLRTTSAAADTGAAREYARSGVEAVIGWSATTTDWRNQYTTFASLMPMGFDRGHVDVEVFDQDGISPLTATSEQRVLIVSTGDVTSGGAESARWVYAVHARQPGLPALATAAHSAGDLKVSDGATCLAEDGPLSSNTLVHVDGTLDGDARGPAINEHGSISGDMSIEPSALEMPDAGVFGIYKGTATTMSAVAVGNLIERRVISPNSNPYGGLNADGLYAITLANDLVIRNTRVVGTLVIDLSSSNRSLSIEQGVHWTPARPDYPILILKGKLYLRSDRDLSEGSTGTNFNPSGTPYQGLTDSAADDTYGSLMRGLIHVVGSSYMTTIQNTTHVEGCVLSEGTIDINGAVHLMADPNLALNPPRRYRTSALAVERGTWTRRVD